MEQFPEQVRTAKSFSCDNDFQSLDKISSIVVTGLGGSAIGGDLVRAIIGESLRKPLIVNRDYKLPPFVGKSTLVFACSYSGNTEETLSAYSHAKLAGAAIICITSGGKMGEQAALDGNPVLSLPKGYPPRAALGFSIFTLLGSLQALEWIPDMAQSIEETIALLEILARKYAPKNPESENIAKRIARSLQGRIVAIYGSNAWHNATAFRWRSQIEENSKTLAFHHALPEMNHNELVGWHFPESVLRDVGVILLRDREDHPQVQRRFELTKEIISGKAGALHEVWSEGESALARVMSLIYLGDYVSLFLAYLNETDPTPVTVIDYFKSKLSS
jgi:glucose/mannose-6-phosphate isomerase